MYCGPEPVPGLLPHNPVAPAFLIAHHVSREKRLALIVHSARIVPLQRLHLECCKAIRGICAFAQQHVGIEVALRRVVDKPVFDSVGRVAGRQRSTLDRGQLFPDI